MLAAFLLEPVLSVAGDTLDALLSAPEDKFRERLGCLVSGVECDAQEPADTAEVSETLSTLLVWL